MAPLLFSSRYFLLYYRKEVFIMKKFENFCFWENGQEEGTQMPFLFAIRDRESKDGR